MKRVSTDEQGIFIVLFAMALVTLILVLGLGIDSAKLRLDSLRIQRAADAAAVVGASRIGPLSNAQVVDLATKIATDNLEQNGIAVTTPASQLTISMTGTNELSVATEAVGTTWIIGQIAEGTGMWDVRGAAVGIRRPVAVVLVADRSSSMNADADPGCSGSCDSKIEALHNAAISFFANFIPDVDVVGVVSFWRHVSLGDYTLKKNWNATDLNAAINGLNTFSGTNLAGGIWAGRQEMSKLTGVVGNPDAFLKVIVLITDGSPTRDHSDTGTYYPAGDPDPYPVAPAYPGAPAAPPDCVKYDGDFSERMKRYAIYSIVEADRARTDGYVLFTIGVGARDSESPGTPAWQTTSASKLKTYLMRRLANDQTAAGVGQPGADPEFPIECVPQYANIASAGNGYFLDSPNGLELQSLLKQVARSIQTLLIQ